MTSSRPLDVAEQLAYWRALGLTAAECCAAVQRPTYGAGWREASRALAAAWNEIHGIQPNAQAARRIGHRKEVIDRSNP